MKATGIVRRMDDLGRIVIPKEIRRNMGVREGDPLEIFTSHDGYICLKKYQPIGVEDWGKATKVVSAVLHNTPFALFDRYEEWQGGKIDYKNAFSDDSDTLVATEVRLDGDVVAYLVTEKECENIYLAVGVLKQLLED